MAKRSKGNSKKKPAKATTKLAATPEDPKPEGKSAANVNPMYDAMPDKVEDPAAVFKLAYLDMRKTAIHNQLAVVIQDYDRQIQALQAKRNQAIKEVKASLAEADRQFNEQKNYIEQTYGLALRCYTYNDETGVLTKQALLEEEAEKNGERGNNETQEPKNETLH